MTDRPPSPQTRRPEHPDAGSTNITVLVRDEREDGAEPQPVDEPRWATLARAVLDQHGVDRAEMSVTFVDERAMSDLNERFMGHSGPTDVLAFPIDGQGGGELHHELPRLIGDVVICPAIAAHNAPDHAGSYEDEVALLLVHGTLHLLGMDHAGAADRERMQQRERQLLEEHHGVLARDPWS